MRRGIGTLVCLVALLGLLVVPTARAAYDPLASGTTVFKLDRGFVALLRSHGVKISTREGASFTGAALRFPVAGGRFDPTTRKGTVEHGGAAVFKRGNRTLPLKGLQLKTTRRSSPFVVRLGGSQLKLGPARRLAVSRQGFGEKVSVSTLKLSAKVASRLSKQLRLRDVFQEGMLVASSVTKAAPTTVTIQGKSNVSLDLDPAMATKLHDLHVAVNPIFPAEHPGPFTFPIFTGKLAPSLSNGFLQLEGAVELLQLGGGQVIWKEPVLDLDSSVVFPREREAVAGLSLGAGSTEANPGARTLAATGATLTLNDSTAATFNDGFAKPQGKQGVFNAGEILGRISFVADAQ
ncbi:MAG TPA: hypothetical protein VNC16_05820 [Solirubrobacterales bacterium]|jgi:hypothetical protein|nr:hypothetical protein [Solirubrobacterales bacterium]